MSNWKEYQLSDLATLKYGKSQKNVVSEDGNIPIYGTGGLMGYSVASLYNEPSILIGRKGTIDKIRFLNQPFWAVDTTFYTVINENYVYPQFLYYYLLQVDFKKYDEGTTIPSLRVETLNRLKLLIPNKEYQFKIISILSSLDDKIELNNRINANLEQQAQVLFKSWFVDFEPFKEDFIESPIGTLIPKSLQMIQISDIPHNLETGKRPKGGAVSEGIPSVGAENVKKLGEFNPSSAKYIPFEFASRIKKGEIKGYELLLYKDGGKPGTFIPHFSMFGEGFPYSYFYINEHVFKLDFFNRGFNEFMYFYLQTDYPYNWLANNGGKAAVPGINQQDINAIWCYQPNHSKVKEFCKWVEPTFTTILTNCAQNMNLAALRDALLPKLVNGEIDVSSVKI